MNQATPNFDEPVFKQVVRTVVREELAPVEKRLNQRMDRGFSDFRNEIGQRFKEFKNDLASMKDEIVTELQTSREESTMHKGQHDRFDEIERRVEKLEDIHPKGQHAAP
jgi:hypothetical protein